MKKMLTIAFCLLSLNAFAAFNEVECEGYSQGKKVTVEIEESFGSYFRRAQVMIENEENDQVNHYTVSARRSAMNDIRYTGGSFRLEVDLWPDQRPTWGRYYRANFSSTEVSHTRLECRFLNVY